MSERMICPYCGGHGCIFCNSSGTLRDDVARLMAKGDQPYEVVGGPVVLELGPDGWVPAVIEPVHGPVVRRCVECGVEITLGQASENGGRCRECSGKRIERIIAGLSRKEAGNAS